jgi:hypothetical protein
VLNPSLVVLARPGRLDGFPGKDISQGVVAVSFYPRKVFVSFLFRERACVELDVVTIEKGFANKGRLVWLAGILGVAGTVDPPKDYLSAVAIAEVAVFYGQAE